MAYADLFADADLYIPLDGNSTASINTGTLTGTTTGNASRIYATDAPTNLGTSQSLKCLATLSATPTFDTYSLPNSGTDKQNYSVSFWIKFVPVGLYNGNEHDCNQYINNNTANHTIYTSYGSTVISAGANNNQTKYYSTANTWHHMAVTVSTHGTTTGYENIHSMYIDGKLIDVGASPTLASVVDTWTSPRNVVEYYSSSTSGTYNLISHFAVWNNKVLSHKEVVNLAYYGQPDKLHVEHVEAVSSLNPLFYYPMDTIESQNYFTNSVSQAWLCDERPTGTAVARVTGPFQNGAMSLSSGDYCYTYTLPGTTSYNTIGSPWNKTFNFWIKVTTTTGATRPICELRQKTSGTYNTANSTRMQLRITAGNNPAIWYRDSDIYPWLYEDPNTINTLPLNEWKMVTITMGGDDVSGGAAGGYAKTYVDGVLIWSEALDSVDTSQPYTLLDGPLVFNRSTSNAGAFTYGSGYSISDFSVYNYEFTQQQVTNLYKSRNQLKYWDGDSWEYPTDNKVHNGTTWVDGTWKHWDGYNWQSLNISV